jgi:hypothetical protein
MDEQVQAALAKWPDVPDCTGWLALDARGRWRIGEAKAGPRLPITHGAMIAFINRNYFAKDRYWVFQNGPQRVFVELEYTPFVWRLIPRAGSGWDLVTHTGEAMMPSSIWLDSDGRFLIEARRDASAAAKAPAIGVVHDHDTALVADLLRDANGEPLGDELSLLSGGVSADADAPPPAFLHWDGGDVPASRLPLHSIASHQVATRFGFEPRPALALRVDLDTRR